MSARVGYGDDRRMSARVGYGDDRRMSAVRVHYVGEPDPTPAA